MGKVLAPHNVCPKTIPLIKRAKGCGFLKYLFSLKIIMKECTKKIVFWA